MLNDSIVICGDVLEKAPAASNQSSKLTSPKRSGLSEIFRPPSNESISLGFAQNSKLGSSTASLSSDTAGKVHHYDALSLSMSQSSLQSDGSFTPSHAMATPQIPARTLSYRDPANRNKLQHVVPPNDRVAIDRPNHEDTLRRVACVVHRHLVSCEEWYKQAQRSSVSEQTNTDFAVRKAQVDVTAPWKVNKAELFREDLYTIPQYKYTFLRTALGLNTSIYRVQQVPRGFDVPSVQSIFVFLHTLFSKAYLSPECSIVGLIYVEKLMEKASIPILSFSWRPIILCGLLLASKVWQDLSTWNVEFNGIYPEFFLEQINVLEALFLKHIEWDLYISSQMYAKYYFALRAITEKKDFRSRYTLIQSNINPPHADKVAQRSKIVKDNYETQMCLSRSL